MIVSSDGLHIDGIVSERDVVRGLGKRGAGILAVHRSDPGLMLGYWGLPQETAAAMRGA